MPPWSIYWPAAIGGIYFYCVKTDLLQIQLRPIIQYLLTHAHARLNGTTMLAKMKQRENVWYRTTTNCLFPMSMTIWFICISPPCKRFDQSNGNLVGSKKREDYLLKKMDPARTKPPSARLISPTTNLHSGAFNSMWLHKHRRLPLQETRIQQAPFAFPQPVSQIFLLKWFGLIRGRRERQNVPVSTKYYFSGQPFTNGRIATTAT